ISMKAAILYENSEILAWEETRKYATLPLKENPLEISYTEIPSLVDSQLLIQVEACGVCYTDIDIIEGRINCNLPVIPGHQVIGRVVDAPKDNYHLIGDRVGVGWIGKTCGNCTYCQRGLENLCADFKATGCHVNGGYAEYMVSYSNYAFKVPNNIEPTNIAPLMCAGAVGYRALRLSELSSGLTLGLFGFGSSAHIILQVARKLYPDLEIYVFSRNLEHRELATRLGADWTGHPQDVPPKKLDRAIDFTPVGETVQRALELMNRGGKLVINVIRKQSPVNLIYEKHLWEEKEIKSVSNVTREDIAGLLNVAREVPLEVNTEIYKLEEINFVLRKLKAARIKGSAVLKIK
ncbi:MAG: zinc-binding alcohol dehydrogenase family protein, partial [Desulfurococcaceae archaeon]